MIVEVHFEGADSTGVAGTKDISLGGLYMSTQGDIPVGATLTLRIPLGNDVRGVEAAADAGLVVAAAHENDGDGLVTLPQLAAWEGAKARPPHNNDQLGMYGDLVYASPGLQRQDLEKYFKDASFGVKPGDAERTYSPRDDVTIVRDKGFGIPHVYGNTRAGTMFGVGYAQAEDRLFLMDVFRRVGRGTSSSLIGGSGREFDHDVWGKAPYREEELNREDNLYAQRLSEPRKARAHYVQLLQLEPQHPQATAIRFWLEANP